jgi:hypothetical protein
VQFYTIQRQIKRNGGSIKLIHEEDSVEMFYSNAKAGRTRILKFGQDFGWFLWLGMISIGYQRERDRERKDSQNLLEPKGQEHEHYRDTGGEEYMAGE